MNIKKITSKDNDIIKYTAKLVKNSSYRKSEARFTAEGVRVCADGVLSGFSPEMFIFTNNAKTKYPEDFKRIAEKSKSLYEISADVFSKISDTKSPQGFFCVYNMLDKPKFPYRINKRGNYLALECVQDPSNVGTILRTAEALGIEGIIMSGHCCDAYSPKVVRGSMGAVFRLPIMITEDFTSYISKLSESGVETFASVPSVDAESITDIKFDGGVMLIGNEGNGLSEKTISVCKRKITIRMKGRAESLNAAAAGAVLIWEMMRG